MGRRSGNAVLAIAAIAACGAAAALAMQADTQRKSTATSAHAPPPLSRALTFLDAGSDADGEAPPEPSGPRFTDTREPVEWGLAGLDMAAGGDQGEVYVTGAKDGRVFAARLDRSGSVLWSRWARNAREPHLVVDASGYPVILWTRWSSAGGVRVAPLLTMLSPDGETVWEREHDATEPFGADLAIDPQGQLLTATESGDTSRSRITWWDRAGSLLQSTTIPHMRVSSLAVDGRGRVVVAGDYFERIDIAGQSFQAKSYRSGMVIARLGAARQPIWAANLGSTGRIQAVVRFDGSGNLVVLTTASEQEDDLLSNLLLVKLDSEGRELFQKRLRFDVEADQLAIDAQDNIWVTALLRGAVDFGAGILRGWDERFVASFDPKGHPRWASMGAPKGCLVVRDRSRRVLLNPASLPVSQSICQVGDAAGHADGGDGAAPLPVQQRSRAVFLHYPTDASTSGIQGTLQALQDSRIQGANHREVTCFGWDVVSGGIPGWDSPPLDSTLQLVDSDKRVVDTYDTAASMIIVDELKLQGDERRTYLVRRKHRVCRSRWQVDRCTLVEVRDGRLREVVSVNEQGGDEKPIWLLSGMMAEFRIVPAAGGGKDILSADSSLAKCGSAECHPALTRYSWDGRRWVRRVTHLDQEGWFGEHFPERGAFP